MALVETKQKASPNHNEHKDHRANHPLKEEINKANHFNHAGHEVPGRHSGHSLMMFARKFWVSLILTIPVIVYSAAPQQFFGFKPPAFPGSDITPLVLSSFIFFYGGLIFLQGAWRELRGRAPGMMTLIALAISVAYFYSLYTVSSRSGTDLFWELTTLIDVMLLGHWLEMRSVQSAQSALKELAKLLPDQADVIRDGKTQTVALSELKINDIVLIRPGGNVPADGIVVEGNSEINEAFVTGESKPVTKKKGDSVVAGTTNGTGSLKVKIDKIGEQTFLAGVMRLVEEAQNSRSRIQILSDRAAFWLTIIAIASGTATLLYWLAAANPNFAIERTVAVLVIACPHALGLAIPLVAAISTSMAARNGVLVRERLSLEMARSVNMVMFDKTGTLTTGQFAVNDIISLHIDKNDILRLAASVNARSEHFLARAMVKRAEEEKIKLEDVRDFQSITGQGVRGKIGKDEILLGGDNLVKEQKIEIPEIVKQPAEKSSQAGNTIIYVIKNKEVVGALALGDQIRTESREAIDNLKNIGIKTGMITGDSDDVAKRVAKELGIEIYFAHVLPGEKAEKIKELQSKNYRVAMIGDGINDAPALTQADIGIAVGAGTNVAIESAGIILAENNPRDIIKIIKLSRATYRKMIANLFWATGYNIIALPLAAGVLYNQGIVLNPAISAVFMSLSTIIVAFNAVLLKRTKLNQ